MDLVEARELFDGDVALQGGLLREVSECDWFVASAAFEWEDERRFPGVGGGSTRYREEGRVSRNGVVTSCSSLRLPPVLWMPYGDNVARADGKSWYGGPRTILTSWTTGFHSSNATVREITIDAGLGEEWAPP